MNSPKFCRPEAYEFFRQQLEILETTPGLVRAAISVAMHADEDLVPHSIEQQLAEIASQVLQRVPSGNSQACLAQLHQVLFDELRFRGETDDYYNPINSYLPVVLRRRRGLPILLALVYKAVAEQVGLQIEGVNSPGHFLLRIIEAPDSRRTLVDPFRSGATYTRDEALRLSSEGETPPDGLYDTIFPTATHWKWIERILRNLEAYFEKHKFLHDLAAMRELLELLGQAPNASQTAV